MSASYFPFLIDVDSVVYGRDISACGHDIGREHTAGRRKQEVNHLKSLRETEWLFACVTRSFLSVFRLQSVSEHLTYAHFYNPSGSRQ